MWKIIFSYKDGSELKISGKQKILPKELAIKYQKQYSKPSNDGGMVHVSPYKDFEPQNLSEYVGE